MILVLLNYYNEEKMFYPARWKKLLFMASEQSPKKPTVPFFLGHPVYKR